MRRQHHGDGKEEDRRRQRRSMSKFHQIIALTLILLSHFNVCKSNTSTRKASTPKPVQDVNRFIATLAGNPARITTAVPSTNQSLKSKNVTNSPTKEHTTDPQIPTTGNDRKVCTGFPMPRIEYKEMCCRRLYQNYAKVWINGARYLVIMLDRLQRWRCNEFDDECKRPTYPLSEYTRRMYDLFCNRSKVETACHADIAQVARRYQFVNESFSRDVVTWKDLIEKLDSSAMELEDLVKSCVQAALFDRSDGGVGRFHEIIEPHAPFCGLQWHGYDFHTAQYRGVSPWTGMPSWCRISIIICIAFMVAACITTIFGNILILCVFGTTSRLRDTQGVYKISLAFADLMIGVGMWPNMIILQYLTFIKPRHMGAVIKRPYSRTANMTLHDNADLVYRNGGGKFGDIFDRKFVVTIGFFSLLGIILSIYILLLAGVDRFWAVYRPLTYNPYVAKRRAVRLNGLLWLVCTVICLLPVFTPGLSYAVMTPNKIFANKKSGFIVSVWIVFIPLVVMWILTGMTYYACRKHTLAGRKLTTCPSNSRRRDLEKRLASTLAMMVLAFSVSVVPVICGAVVGFTPAATKWYRPRALSIKTANAYTTSGYLALIMLTSNSLWNLFIYYWRVQEFRKAALRMFRERFRQCVLQCGVEKVPTTKQAARPSIAINVGCSDNPASSKLPTSEPCSLEVKQSHLDRPRLTITVDSDCEMTSNDTVHSENDRRQPPKASNARRYQSPTARSAEELRERRSTIFGSFVIKANTANLYQSVMSSLTENTERAQASR